jgi:hypothetical protein
MNFMYMELITSEGVLLNEGCINMNGVMATCLLMSCAEQRIKDGRLSHT